MFQFGSALMRAVRGREGLLAVLSVAIAFHAVAYHYLEAYYAKNLPHYDSMGSYITMFEIINHYRAEGFMGALPIASGDFMSWMQGYFALFGAAFLNTTPESVQLLNSLAMLAFMLSIYAAAKAYGASEPKAYLLSLMVFLPDVFYDWLGGMLDMRRDFAFISFLGATFFLFFAFVQNRRPVTSALLGLTAGLTVYTRDNAIFFLVLIMAPILLAWLAAEWRSSRSLPLRRLFPAVFVAMLLILPWLYFNLASTLARRLNPFVIYGAGDSPWSSFLAHWVKPLALMFGWPGTYPSGLDAWEPPTELGRMLGAQLVAALLGGLGGPHATLFLTMLGVAIGGVVLWQLKRQGYLEWQIRRQNYGLGWVVVAGAWALVATYFVICVVVGLRALEYSSAQIPFFPSLLFFFSLLFGAGISLSRSNALSPRSVAALCGLSTLLVISWAILRMEVKAPEQTPHYISLARRLANTLVADGRAVSVAYLWHETISYDTLRFYGAQAGTRFGAEKFRFTFQGQRHDFAVGVPPGVSPEDMSHAAHEQIEQNADYVVLCTTAGTYSRKGHPLFLYEHGQPMVDALLHSENFAHVFEFEMWGQSFVLLKRQGKRRNAGQPAVLQSQALLLAARR